MECTFQVLISRSLLKNWNCVKFIQIMIRTINLSHINKHYYLKLQTPMGHRLYFIKIAQNHNYIQTHCNDRRNPFHFACRQ